MEDEIDQPDSISERRQAFVLRLREQGDANDKPDAQRLIVDLEDVNLQKIFRFTNLESAFSKIRSLLLPHFQSSKPSDPNGVKGNNHD